MAHYGEGEIEDKYTYPCNGRFAHARGSQNDDFDIVGFLRFGLVRLIETIDTVIVRGIDLPIGAPVAPVAP